MDQQQEATEAADYWADKDSMAMQTEVNWQMLPGDWQTISVEDWRAIRVQLDRIEKMLSRIYERE